jgi:ATP-dependent DNA helicase RecG
MWANTVPEGGILVVGQEDNGSFTGCSKLSQNALNDIEKAGRVYCPDARTDSKRIPVFDADGHENFVLVFRIQYREDKVVSDISGNAFTRVGDEKRKLAARVNSRV